MLFNYCGGGTRFGRETHNLENYRWSPYHACRSAKIFFCHLSCMQERKNIFFMHARAQKIFFFVSNAVLNSCYLVMPAKAPKIQKAGKAGAVPGGVNFPPPPPPGGNLPDRFYSAMPAKTCVASVLGRPFFLWKCTL